jgi:AraC-like DNA-binding protein
MNAIFSIGIFLCFFLLLILVSKKNKSTSDKLLSALMFLFGLHLLNYYSYTLGYWQIYPHLIGITHPFPLFYGPLIYLYTALSLRIDQKFTWSDALHFSPVILSYLYMVRFIFFYTAEEKIIVDQDMVSDFKIFMYVSLVAFIFSGIVYPILSYRLLNRYQAFINQNFSYEESISLNWLKYLIWGIGFLFFVVAIISLLREVLGFDFGFNADLIIYSTVIIFVFFLGYFGIRQRGVFLNPTTHENQIVEPLSLAEYKKSALKSTDAVHYHQLLLQIMNDERPYLEPKLSLGNLATKLGISVNHLSQIINQQEGKSFYDFINEYRVDEFKARIKKPENQNYSFQAIAFDSGFNSKSSFNQVFKKHMGKTPTQYVAEIKN